MFLNAPCSEYSIKFCQFQVIKMNILSVLCALIVVLVEKNFAKLRHLILFFYIFFFFGCQFPVIVAGTKDALGCIKCISLETKGYFTQKS